MFENCYWCQEKQIAAICMDTWGCEVRPNETTEANQPWHWVVIPAMGLCMGEIFYLKELAEDCENDGIYEFFFCGPPLIITGGTGSPINPQAIKYPSVIPDGAAIGSRASSPARAGFPGVHVFIDSIEQGRGWPGQARLRGDDADE